MRDTKSNAVTQSGGGMEANLKYLRLKLNTLQNLHPHWNPIRTLDASEDDALLTLVPPPLEFPGVWLADETKCQVRVATYVEPDQPAVQAVWMVGKAHSLDPHGQAYPIPFPCNSWREFEFYSTSDEQYHPVNGPIDMTDRGAFILFRKLRGGHCPDIAHWEEHAVRLADKEGAPYSQFSNSLTYFGQAGKPNYTPSKAAIRRPPTRASTLDISYSVRSTPSKDSAASASPSADESPKKNVDEPSNNLVKDVETWLAATTRDQVTSSKRKRESSGRTERRTRKKAKLGSYTNPYVIYDSD
ncbi:hypothetical protein C8F04DRAFT_1200217 [Mycena alexandri]|uniref:Uncharacterized protein n=1 Tax=Mycena alexandri TaxID=1745969 RepID=A0AAD6RY22_9AGAR|nr:hypothetical protein C8F04DRAFT_1200217 [Mycena alexandri]